jgi:hypothetical protein
MNLANRRPFRRVQRLRWALAAPLALATLGVAPLARWGGASQDPDFGADNVSYDGSFTFVRFRYTPAPTGWSGRGGRGGGGGYFGPNYYWDHDYPRAERHLTVILRELTSIEPHAEGTNILGADDPELFKYPLAYVSEPGYWTMSDEEAENLRAYLTKGGMLIIDDFQGGQWRGFERALKQILPDARPIELDATHPIFNSFFSIEHLDHVHPLSGVPSYFVGIFEGNDPEGRLLMIVNYNNDIGESWEYSNTGFIPIDLTNKAYRLGVNYVVYAMTH